MTELSATLYALRVPALLVAMIVVLASNDPVWVVLLAVFLIVSSVTSWLYTSGKISLGERPDRTVVAHFGADIMLALVSLTTACMVVNKTVTLVTLVAVAGAAMLRGVTVKVPTRPATPWVVEFITAASLSFVLVKLASPYSLAAAAGSIAIFVAAAIAAIGMRGVVVRSLARRAG